MFVCTHMIYIFVCVYIYTFTDQRILHCMFDVNQLETRIIIHERILEESAKGDCNKHGAQTTNDKRNSV